MSQSRDLLPDAGLAGDRRATLVAWNVIVAVVVAGCAAVILAGRTNPLHASLQWIAVFTGALLLAALGLTGFARRMAAARGTEGTLRASLLVNGPLGALCLVAMVAIYLSDEVNHQAAYFLQPTTFVLFAIAVLATLVAQRVAVLKVAGSARPLGLALEEFSTWAIAAALLALGLLQGASFVWVIGNDFTRYWNVADAISSWSGYPAMRTLPLYFQIGEPAYTVDLPGFPLLLLAAFRLVGHDTLAAEIPNLLANAILPLVTYSFLRLAGIGRGLAFAGSVLLVTQPFFRLYTLNAPVPDAVFMALLVGTVCCFQRAAAATGPSVGRWMVFGLLAGASALERPEGTFFLAFMALALFPRLRERGPWIAAGTASALLLPFVVVMRTTFGFLWPNNAGSTMGLRNVEVNLHWLGVKTLAWYADALHLTVAQLIALLGAIAVLVVAGTILLARDRSRLALLPVAAAVNIAIVFTVDQSVSGVHLWFDFFRHVSYGLPFLALPAFYLLDRSVGARARLRWAATPAIGLLLLGAGMFQLNSLSYPSDSYSQSYGQSARLLTSDVWVSLQDLVEHRYPLPTIETERDGSGVLVPSRAFETKYLAQHLDRVRAFFEPYSALNVNRGTQYEYSSMLVVLFGAVFALARARGEVERHA
ncbi:MAG TPA: hypothetical protein VF960_05685 [Chloroflexota bacterium]